MELFLSGCLSVFLSLSFVFCLCLCLSVLLGFVYHDLEFSSRKPNDKFNGSRRPVPINLAAESDSVGIDVMYRLVVSTTFRHAELFCFLKARAASEPPPKYRLISTKIFHQQITPAVRFLVIARADSNTL